MLAKRIIPLFLLNGQTQRLVKGTRFADFVDVGDPVSQGMVYDAQGAEEIAVVDITATAEDRTIDPAIITAMIQKCKLPIAAGGGIQTIADAKRCFDAGADKIIVNTHAITNEHLIRELSNEYGAQAVLVSLDVTQNDAGQWEVYTHGGTRKTGLTLDQALKKVIQDGAGEIMICEIDREGTMKGFDVSLYQTARELCSVPLIASGGAGKYQDLVDVCDGADVDACAIGKMLFLRDYDIVRIKAYLTNQKVLVRDA